MLNDLFAYLKAVFVETWQKIFTIFDILGIVLFLYPQLATDLVNNETFVRIIGILILLFSFFLANFSLYRKLTQNLSYQADLRVEVLGKGFSHSHGGRNSFREIKGNPGGFTKQGIPDWGTLWANLSITNIGYERGQFIWELDQTKIKLPSLFASDKFNIRFNSPRSVEARKSLRAELYFDVQFTERDPRVFAQELKKLVKSKKKYQVVIRYKTKRIDGESKIRELCLKGDFQEFHQAVLKHWDDFGFNDLAELARITY